MDESLQYFRHAIADPQSVPPWSEWWAANAERVQNEFPLVDWVRLKHRKLRGAREILMHRGELPPDFRPPGPFETNSCSECGERLTDLPTDHKGETIQCPHCRVKYHFMVPPEAS